MNTTNTTIFDGFGNQTLLQFTGNSSNCFNGSNCNQTWTGQHQSLPIPVPFWMFLAIETLITIIGNATLVWLFASNRKLRTNQNYFIVSLSVGDLLVGLSVAPCEYCRIKPNLGYCMSFCGSIISFNMLSSVFNLCLIAIDRYLSINKPYLYVEIFTKKRALLAIMTAWVTTIVLTTLPFSWITSLKGNPIANTINMAFSGVLFTLTIAAGIGLSLSYYIIVSTVRSKMKLSREPPSNPAGVKVCIISSIIFFISWLPYVVVEMYMQQGFELTSYFYTIMDAAYFVLLLSPCFDPLLYAYYRRDFRNCLLLVYRRNFSWLGVLCKRLNYKNKKKEESGGLVQRTDPRKTGNRQARQIMIKDDGLKLVSHVKFSTDNHII